MAQGDIWKKLRGTMTSLFGVGNEDDGFNIKNASGKAEIRNAADTAYEIIRAAHIASGGGLNDLPTLLDLQARVPNIEYSFDGDSAPSAGSNSGKFGICHTDGSSYNAGNVVYDTGSTLILIPTEVVRTVTTSSAVSGTLSMNANGLYAWQGGTWILKGDGAPAQTGILRTIDVPTSTNATYDSTTSVPSGARVVRTAYVVETAYTASTTAVVSIAGTTPQELLGTNDSKLSNVGEYDNDAVFNIDSSSEGLVHVAITGTPAAGAGRVIVFYATPSA